MFTVTLHIVLIAFVITEAAKVWAEHKTWNQHFQQSQLKNDKTMSVIEGRFDRSELIALTAAETNEQPELVGEVLKAAFRILATQICLQEKGATIEGFGSFRVDELAARSGKDPNGKDFSAPERLTIQFNPEKRFRDELSELTGKVVIA